MVGVGLKFITLAMFGTATAGQITEGGADTQYVGSPLSKNQKSSEIKTHSFRFSFHPIQQSWLQRMLFPTLWTLEVLLLS